jgi:hypothetical protein
MAEPCVKHEKPSCLFTLHALHLPFLIQTPRDKDFLCHEHAI